MFFDEHKLLIELCLSKGRRLSFGSYKKYSTWT